MSCRPEPTGIGIATPTGKPCADEPAMGRAASALAVFRCHTVVGLAAIGLAWLSGTLAAADRTFTLGGVSLPLTDLSAEVEVRYRSMRLNRASNVWNAELVVANTGTRTLEGPFLLRVDGFGGTSGPIQPDGLDNSTPARPFYELSAFIPSGTLLPGGLSQPRTLTLGLSAGAPRLTATVFGRVRDSAFSLGFARSLNDAGQPLGGVGVAETGPDPGGGTRDYLTDGTGGFVTLGQSAGAHGWKFTQPGHLPVWRFADLETGAVLRVPSPRLTRRSTNSATVTVLQGGVVAAEGVQIAFPGGAFLNPTVATLTALNGQTLPAFLPRGWSPLQAFWLELAAEPLGAGTATLTLLDSLGAGEGIALVRWDEADLRWIVVESFTGSGGKVVPASIRRAGAYAVVVADRPPAPVPPLPQAGQPLLASSGADPSAGSLGATGWVSPPVSPADRNPMRVTAQATVAVTNRTGPVRSGLILPCDVEESYRLREGSTRVTPRYDHFVVGYQRPGDADAGTVHATFPMRPVLLFGAEELEEATVRVTVQSSADFAGGVLSSFGGEVAGDSLRLLAGTNTVARDQAILVRGLPAGLFTNLVSGGLTVIGAFDLLTAELALGHNLVLRWAGAPADRLLVLARAILSEGLYGLQPVERLRSDANGNLASLEPAVGERLPGITRAGTYVLVQVVAPQGLVTGVAENGAGQPTEGMPVRIADSPWLALSDANGFFRLVAPAGPAELSVTDPATSDAGIGIATVADAQVPVTANLTATPAGPRVVSVSPAEGATRVPRVTAVVLGFSEPIHPGSLGAAGIQLLGTNDQPVAATFSLNLRNTSATLLPSAPLAANTRHRIRVATTVTDPGGRPLEGPNEFAFTTIPSSARESGSQLIVFEPGGTNVPSDVLDQIPAYDPARDRDGVVVRGTPGAADPEVAVIVANESTGETATVLSRPDGSFTTFVRGVEEDFVSATFINLNGTRTYVPVSRQLFDNGFVGLYEQGGILEAQSDGGPVRVFVEPGAIEARNTFQLRSVDLSALLGLVKGTQPEGGRLLGGVEYTEAGDELKTAADIEVPVNVSSLGLPVGLDPEDAAFALTIPREYDGTVVYEIVDTMDFAATEPGRGTLRTRSPPYLGILLRQLGDLQQNTMRPDALSRIRVASAEGESTGLFSFLSLGTSKGTTIAGRVVTGPVNNEGQLLEPIRPVSGAIVALDFVGAERAPGNFRAGELIATSDRDGRFAFHLRPDESAAGRYLLATHPRFPFQQARSPGALPSSGGTTAIEVDLVFGQPTSDPGSATGLAAPRIDLSHEPLFPPVGLGPLDGTRLRVRATDDTVVVAVDVVVEELAVLVGTQVLDPAMVAVASGPPQQPSPDRWLQDFQLRSPQAGRARLRIQAVDDGGRLTALYYTVPFGGAPPELPPGDTNDVTGPRVVRAWPPDGATHVPSLAPIQLRFSERIALEWLNQTAWNWIAMDDEHSVVRIQASPDQREITVYYEGDPDGPVTLTVSAPLSDQNGNAFHQDPTPEGSQAFSLTFQQSGRPEAALPGIENGSGVVFLGAYAYALDRTAATGGRLVSFDLTVPQAPVVFDELELPGWPTDLALIPDYSLAMGVTVADGVPVSSTCQRANFLAVFTGAANERKHLTLVPAAGALETGFFTKPIEATLSFGEAAMVTRSKWDAPFLGYLELGADVTSIALLNLNAFHTGYTADDDTIAQFPAEGFPGTDQNFDGDFCDPGDVPPLPGRPDSQVFGLTFSWAPLNPDERIVDFDFSAEFGLVGVVWVNRRLQTAGYRTVLAGLGGAVLDDAVTLFPSGEQPKRLLYLPDTVLDTAAGVVVKDLALVSFAGDPGWVRVLDLADPTAPIDLGRINLPPGEGSANSIILRPDGRLALATGRSTLFLDSRQLLAPENLQLTHPAITGRIDGTGGSAPSFVADTTGVTLVNAGASSALVQLAPQLEVVTLGTNQPLVAAESLKELEPEAIRAHLEDARPIAIAQVAGFNFTNLPPAPDPRLHYYVLLRLPGGAGPVIELAAAATDAHGRRIGSSLANHLPTVLAAQETTTLFKVMTVVEALEVVQLSAQLWQAASQVDGLATLTSFLITSYGKASKLIDRVQAYLEGVDGYPSRLRAYRLAPEARKESDLYNTYLAGPLVLLARPLTQERVDALQDQLPRHYLRASASFWVGLEEHQPDNPAAGAVIGRFTSRVTSANGLLSIDPEFSLPAPDIFAEQVRSAYAVGQNPMTELPGPFNLHTEFDPVLSPGVNVRKPVALIARPLVFVPGIMASYLEGPDPGGDPDDHLGYWVLGQFLNALGPLATPRPLDMNADGTSAVSGLHASDVLRQIPERLPIGAVIYKDLIDFLVTELGYVEYDFKTGLLGDQPLSENPQLWHRRRQLAGPGASPRLDQDPPANLFVFPYDWRQDNAVSAGQLRDYVGLVLALHPDSRQVDLLAHSMGGLVSRRFLLDNPTLVARFITLGTPWFGAPKALAAMRSGDFDDLAMNITVPRPVLRRLGMFMPALHQLLPAKGLFDLGLNPVFEAGLDANHNGLAYEPYNYAQYASALEHHLFTNTLAELYGPSAPALSPSRQNHEQFHSYKDGLLADWSQDALPVEYHHLFGIQSVPNTVGRVALSTWLAPVDAPANDLLLGAPPVAFRESDDVVGDYGPTPEQLAAAVFPIGTAQYRLKEAAEMLRVSGDGTVPLLSLARGAGSQKDRNAPTARLIPIVSTGVTTDGEAEHNGMLRNPRTLEVLADILFGGVPETVAVEIEPVGELTEGDEVLFTANHTGTPGAVGQATYLWDFGDGGTYRQTIDAGSGSLEAPHVFLDDGEYTVSCAVTFENGVAGYTSRTVVVQNEPPTVHLEPVGAPQAPGRTITLAARVQDPGVYDTHRFHWDFDGDGTTDFDGSFLAVHTFERPGTYPVTVVAEDNSSGTHTATLTVQVDDDHAILATPPPDLDPPYLPSGGQPQIYVRVSGQDFWISDGISVCHDTATVYGIIVPSLASVAAPIARMMEGVRAEDASKESVFVSAFRKTGDGISPTAQTRIRVQGADRNVTFEALYLEGGVPQKLLSWEFPLAATEGAALRFDWETKLFEAWTWSIFDDPVGLADPCFVPSGASEVAPRTVVLGLAAADRSGPAVAGVRNDRTDRVYLVGADAYTPETNLLYYVAIDADEDGDLTDEVFREVTARHLLNAALPGRPMVILARDAVGNLSDPTYFRPTRTSDPDFAHTPAGLPAAAPDPPFCDRLETIRSTLRQAVVEALGSDGLKQMLVHEDDLWIFEQGSGACLWKADSCDGCAGVFKPERSDNDYELFIPVHKASPKPPEDFLASDPHSPENMTGDWYFLPPTGLDVAGDTVPALLPDGSVNPAVVRWYYRLPDALLNGLGASEFDVVRPASPTAPGNPFFRPLAPAEAIAFFLTFAVTNNPAYSAVLPKVSFFPFRREHFVNATMSLEKPPAFGDDPIGDAGMGRQLLLLKWLLEGAYVTFPAAPELNDNTVALTTIFDTLKARGVPLADGFEWGVYQDSAALHGAVQLKLERRPEGIDAVPPAARHDFFTAKEEDTIKKLGKAAIRGALARLAGDPLFQSKVLSISPAQYQAQGFRSFEHFIAFVATNSPADAAEAYGTFTPRIEDFLRAKLGDETFIRRLIEAGQVDAFVADGFKFLRRVVQDRTLAAYETAMAGLAAAQPAYEHTARVRNMSDIDHGFNVPDVGKSYPGRHRLNGEAGGTDLEVELYLRVYNWGPSPATGLELRGQPGAGGPPPLKDGTENDPWEELTQVDLPALPGDTQSETLVGDVETDVNFYGTVLSGSAVEETADLTLTGDAFEDEDTQVDNRIALSRSLRAVPEAPTYRDDFVSVGIFLDPLGAEVLGDWPELPDGHPRSARHLLGSSDRLYLRVHSQAGLGDHHFRAEVTTDTDPDGFVLPLSEISPGVYQNEAPDQSLRVGPDSGTTEAVLAVKDEELLRVRIRDPEGQLRAETDAMIDRAELAIATLQHADRPDSRKPRFDYQARMIASGPRYFDAGFEQFPDDVAVSAGGGDNPMREFLRQFGQPGQNQNGEADVLYAHLHGGKNGSLFDHQTNLPASQRLVLAPATHLAAEGRWNTDAEFFISEACNILNHGINADLSPLGFTPGKEHWTSVLTDSARPIHGILGFTFGKTASRSLTVAFLEKVHQGTAIPKAWAEVLGATGREWGFLFFKSATNDTFRLVSRDPLPTDPLSYAEYLGVYTDEDSEDSAEAGGRNAPGVDWLPGYWASPAVLTQPRRPPDVPAQMQVGAPGSVLQTRHGLPVRSSSDFDELQTAPATIGNMAAQPFAASTATEVARRFLAKVTGVEDPQLTWLGTGAVREREIHQGRSTPPRVIAYLVRFQEHVAGLPIDARTLTVEVGPEGVRRVSARQRPEIVPPAADVQRVAPRGLSEVLQAAALASPSSPIRLSEAFLCWAFVAGPPAVAVPAWRIQLAPASADGAVLGDSEVLFLDALTGRRLEVEE